MDRDEDEVTDGERVMQKGKVDKQIYSMVVKNLKKAHDKQVKVYQLRFKNNALVYSVG